MNSHIRKNLALALVILVALAGECLGSHEYPRVACLLLGHARPDHCEALSKYDLVVLGTSVQDYYPTLVDTLRSLNPEITVLAYFPTCFIWAGYDSMTPTAAAYGFKADDCDWWLYDTKGNRVGPENHEIFVNFYRAVPVDETGQTIGEWLAHYVSDAIISTGLWDGIFVDGPYEDISWVNSVDSFFRDPPAAIDADRDGVADHPDSIHAWWRDMLESYLATLRQDIGDSYVLVGNGNNSMSQYLNGGAREAFPTMNGDWEENMFAPYGYVTMCREWLQVPMNGSMVLSYHRSDDNTLYEPKRTLSYERYLRYTLTSALLDDGYYYIGHPHRTLWWEDYFDLDLGNPVTVAHMDSVWNDVYGYYCPIWKREFENATVICNPGPRYAIMPDGTWIFPEDGLIESHVSPCCLGIEITRRNSMIRFDQRDWGVSYDAVIVNGSDNATYGYVWARLTDQGDTVASGGIRQFLIGARDSLEKRLSLRVPSTLPLGTYCLEVFVGGPDYVSTDHDTLFVRRIIDFEDLARQSDDGREEGSLTVYPQPLVMSRGIMRMEVTRGAKTTRMCSINLYDVRGRLLGTLFEGELEHGVSLEINLMGEGGESIVPGVYFLSAELGDETCIEKIVLLR